MKLNLKLALYILIIIFFLVWGIFRFKTASNKVNKLPVLIFPTITLSPTLSVASQEAELAMVSRVVDGDTIELADGRKVRYIGVDTPELHHPTKGVQCFGQEAMVKNKELVEGKTVRMEKDVSDTDRYKRLLRYVWIGDTFINEYLVREGYAFQATFPPDVKYAELFRAAAEEARINKKGLWKMCK